MNLRDFFRFRRSRKDSDDAQPDAEPLRRRELRNAWRALETEDFDTAAMLGQEHVNATDGELALESKKIVALAQFRKEHYSVATPLFQEIANSTNDVADWFNVDMYNQRTQLVGGKQEAGNGLEMAEEDVDFK